MKIKREILAFFLAIMLFPLTCGFAFAELNIGDYQLGGYLELGGGFLSDYPNARNRGYLVQYTPFPVGPLGGVDLSLKSKDELEYYNFRMSNPGFTANQDFLLQIGKLGVYHAQVEYDQFQHVYSTVNPINSDLGILLQRLRFSADYLVTPEIDLFIEDQWLRRTGQRPVTYETGPGNPFQYTTYTEPIGFSQNDAKVGAEYDSKTYQFRLGYHLSTFVDDTPTVRGLAASTTFVSTPPSNMANYITAEGGANLAAYKTRITGSFSYGWLSQNENVYNSGGNAYAFNGYPYGPTGLSATTVEGDISGVTRPTEALSLRYSYKAYDFQNNNLNNYLYQDIFSTASLGVGERPLLLQEQYSYLRQNVKGGVDYKVNDMVALDAAYTFSATDRTENQGNTTSNSPQFGIRLFPTSWLNLIANYTYSQRLGNDFLSLTPSTPANLLTYKFYSGDDKRNAAHFVAEAFPVNNVTFSANFSFYNDNFNDSNGYGLTKDQGWSAGGDVSWTPTDRVALSLGYDHQEDITKERVENQPGLVGGGTAFSPVYFDWGPLVSTLDAYDTFIARADIKLIPDKLKLTTGVSYSFSSSHFDNPQMSHLNEAFADINAGLSYKFNEHWSCRALYRLEIFNMTKAYQQFFLNGTPAPTNQNLNTLDGFYRNATANVFEGFVQYKF